MLWLAVRINVMHGETLLSYFQKVHQKMEYKEEQEDDPKRRKPDIKRAFDNLGWKPVVSSF